MQGSEDRRPAALHPMAPPHYTRWPHSPRVPHSSFRTHGPRRGCNAPDLRKVPGTEMVRVFLRVPGAGSGSQSWNLRPRTCPGPLSPGKQECAAAAETRGWARGAPTRWLRSSQRPGTAPGKPGPTAATPLSSSPSSPRAGGENRASKGEQRPRSLGFPSQPCHALAVMP